MVQINPKFIYPWIRWLLFLPPFTPFTIVRSCSGAIFFIPHCTGLDSVCASKRPSQRIPRQQCLPDSWTLSGDDCQGSCKPGCTIEINRGLQPSGLQSYQSRERDIGVLNQEGKTMSIQQGHKPIWILVKCQNTSVIVL